MARQQSLLIGFVCAACVACAPRPAPEILEVRDYQASFLCEDNLSIHAVFTPYKAMLEAQGGSIAMAQQPSADGLRYTGDGQSLLAHGSDAIWTDGKGAVHHCHEAIAAAKRP